MTSYFTTILNMSITASYVALAVIAIRIPFKKIPKIFSYALWLPVLIRLIFPFSFNSSFSFLGFLKHNAQTNSAMEYVPNNIGFMQNPAVSVGSNEINTVVNTSLPIATPTASANPMQLIIEIASIIWVVGIVILLIYSIISYLKVINNVKTATLVKENIFETDRITTPFVCGLIEPKIYIPTSLNENELSYILAHEQTHIKRLDYLVKPCAFLVLILHWFNPLMWLSFALMSKDMEMSCDESVVKEMDIAIKGSYAHSLLSLSLKRSSLLMGSPLAFGESNIKSRIKNILAYKKPAFWVITVTVVVTAALIVVLTANPKIEQAVDPTMDLAYDIEVLITNKTPYVGNNSKVVTLIDAMSLPVGIVRDTVELQTSNQPYEITINLNITDASAISTNIARTVNSLYKNSILLFSLIDNVDIINYQFLDDNSNYDDAPLTYTRKMVENGIGYDVRSFAETSASLKLLIDELNNMSVGKVSSFTVGTEKADQIERYLEIIMSSPNTSSNPSNYITAHQDEYESILKMGDDALNYLLSQFQKGSIDNDLRGHIIMALCKELLGDRNNVTDESLSPQDWFSQLSLREEIKLPDFKANVSDPIEQLVYDTAIKQYSQPSEGFTVVAPTIFGSYEEKNKLKVFVTVFSSRYRLYDKTTSEVGGSVVPAAITYTKNEDGSFKLDEYLEAMDGSYFSKSIKEYCIMPISKKEINGLFDRIMNDYGNNKNRSELLIKNLIEHLESNNQKDIVLKRITGELEPLT